jgi:hypothetical protein
MRYLFLLNSLAATFFWVYFLSDGFHAAGLLDGVYELQAQALSQLRLSIEPGPKDLFYFDVSLYNGKYFFYQGMLPAIIHAGLMKIFGRIVSSYLVTSGFLFCLVYFFQRIIGDIVESALKDSDSHQFWLKSSSLTLLWLFLFNLPFPFNKFIWFFGRFSIYEQQIVFALSVIMPALFLLNRGLKTQNERMVCFFAFLCSLAAWTRGSWFIFACLSIVAAFIYSAWHHNAKLFSAPSRKVVLWLMASISLLCGLLALNFIRFESLIDFGLKHQNPASYRYLRTLTGVFSPATKFWDFIFNIFAYYGSPDLAKGLALMGKSSSGWEYLPTSFFYYNPQFLPVLILVPLGLFQAYRKNWELFLLMVGIGLTAIYMNVFIAAVATFSILRFFIEFYYFVILLFFMVIVMLVRFRFSLLVIILLLCVHLPGNIEAFATFRPELRLVDPDKNMEVIVDENRHKLPQTPFIEKDPVWFKQTVAYSRRETFNEYNGIGAYPGSDEMVLSRDMAALYIVPGSVVTEGICSKTALAVKRLKSIDVDGTVKFYIDGCYIGDLRVNMQTSTTGCLPVENTLQRDVPYQILLVFIPEGKKFLPPRLSKKTVFVFKEISLSME